ncbi:MAG: hypothetical protein PHY48_12345 [Candidatus Cloacimonetes bacterium]|nr:hypothetical protein [Candidatus Cloacimonadota bacterium]
MNKHFTRIFTITVAAVLVSSIAYAAKKKLQTKSEPLAPDVSETDLAANLLDTKADNKHLSPKHDEADKHDDEELKDLTIAMKQ